MEKLQALDGKASTGTAIHEEIQQLTQNASTLDEKSFNQMIERAFLVGAQRRLKLFLSLVEAFFIADCSFRHSWL